MMTLHRATMHRVFGRLARRLFALAVFLAGAALPAGAQTSDVTPPTLVSFSFAPTAVDVSAAPQAITFAAHVTDNLAGVNFTIGVQLRSPTGAVTLFGNPSRVSGTSLNGMYSGQITIPLFAAAGTWTVSIVGIADLAGNSSTFGTAQLAENGFPTQLVVISNPDTQAPNVTAISVGPGTVDVSTGDQTLTVDLRVTDDLSGVAFAPCVPGQGSPVSVILRGPTNSTLTPPALQNRYIFPRSFSLVSGTNLDGIWRATVVMPRYSDAGVWRLQQVGVRDCAGNIRSVSDATLVAAGLQVGVNVVSIPEDVEPPILTSLTVTPISINTSTGNQVVTVRYGISDNLSGAAFTPTTSQTSFFEAGVNFRSPSGQQSQGTGFFSPATLASGTPLNGVWQQQITFPRFSEEGTWQIISLVIKDAVRNMRPFTTATLAAAGFSTTLDVRRPSLTTDAIVGSGGGTVFDQTFGNRASVTFPPGALTGATEVAIDVFLNPPQIPTPQGFLQPGTNFVNIQLTPQPNFPLPAPGLTVVLPLTLQRPAGTVLHLYKIDEATGLLVPAISVSGSPVLGTVNADLLSATFTGIASLSTVVGLLPQPIQVGLEVRPGGSTTIAVGAQLVVNTSASAVEDPAGGPWRYVIEWGDGTNFTATLTSLPPAARPLPRAKVYAAPGIYTVRLTVTDRNGLSGTRTLLVTVNP